MKPVNLNKARKAKARAQKKARAEENAVKFGQSKAEKSKTSAERISLRQKLDQHKLDT
ncbi:DUF4169 family protein [Litoreibacter roseus]|uniref:DUF4169 domain-containing protein n=1 Tax=Litoreibacter roseus TaxID=2601869 RepID=A0A6N6JKJ3_9RHOB|nr:DUF4169 family protein [Litoreibacter roseus]GFE66674.1 hypothetical protein KIN_37480 [Litoreibacter roseus]